MAKYLDVEQPPPPMQIDVTSSDGKTTAKAPNPEFQTWYAQDQQVFSYLLTTLPREIAIQVASCHTAAELWNTVEGMLASHTRSQTTNVRIALANLQKGNSSITDYVGKIKSLCDELIAAGKRVDDDDIVSHILAGLEEDFDPVVSAMCSRVEPVTVPELYSQLVSFETRMNLRHGGSQSSANAATCGRGRGSGDRGRGRQGGGNSGGDRDRPYTKQNGRGGGGRGNYNNSAPAPKVVCQICGKPGHPAWKCWKRYDE